MWYKNDNVICHIPRRPVYTRKIAGFDLVHTLIWSSRGDYIPREDWVWTSEALPNFLKQLSETGWMIVVFSNARKDEGLVKRVKEMFEDVGEFFFFASLSNEYHKPNRAMWDLFVTHWEKCGNSFILDPNSFFIGDRGDLESEDPMFRKGLEDAHFAEKIGLNFLLPSELPSCYEPDFPETQELIITIGQQGSGKTTYVRNISKTYPSYQCIHNDEIPKGKRLRVITDILKSGMSVIVDGTYPSNASREPIIELAEEHNVPVRFFWFSRPGRYWNSEREKPIPEVALRRYTKEFEYPEGEVVRIN